MSYAREWNILFEENKNLKAKLKKIRAEKRELQKLLKAYDKYVIGYAEEHGVCEDGCYPVCVNEFRDNEMQENDSE